MLKLNVSQNPIKSLKEIGKAKSYTNRINIPRPSLHHTPIKATKSGDSAQKPQWDSSKPIVIGHVKQACYSSITLNSSCSDLSNLTLDTSGDLVSEPPKSIE